MNHFFFAKKLYVRLAKIVKLPRQTHDWMSNVCRAYGAFLRSAAPAFAADTRHTIFYKGFAAGE